MQCNNNFKISLPFLLTAFKISLPFLLTARPFHFNFLHVCNLHPRNNQSNRTVFEQSTHNSWWSQTKSQKFSELRHLPKSKGISDQHTSEAKLIKFLQRFKVRGKQSAKEESMPIKANSLKSHTIFVLFQALWQKPKFSPMARGEQPAPRFTRIHSFDCWNEARYQFNDGGWYFHFLQGTACTSQNLVQCSTDFFPLIG